MKTRTLRNRIRSEKLKDEVIVRWRGKGLEKVGVLEHDVPAC